MTDVLTEGTEPALLQLIRAIAADDAVDVESTLRRSSGLATVSLDGGATRADPTEYWLAAIEHYVYAGDTALHIAAAAHRPSSVRLLLSLGARPGASNRRRAQPLHYAADGAPGSRHWRPADQAIVISCLIDAGADPNAADLNGTAPLHRAVRTRCSAAVDALLDGGADPDRTNRNGSTPMMLATRMTGRGGSGSAAAVAEQHKIVSLLQSRVDH